MLSYTLNKRVLIQAPATGQDEYGEPLAGWTNVISEGDGKIWAGIKDLTGRQYIAAQATQNPVDSIIAIRYRPGVTASMRVLHGADVYDIQAVLGQDQRMLELLCKRGVSNG